MGSFNRGRKFGRRAADRPSYGSQRGFGRDSDRSGRSGFGRSGFEKEMHNAVCDKCGERCEVPFRPTGNKPVYCSNCFRKNERFESESPGQNRTELEKINEKLDRILKALERS